jgi:hypothetical protein
MLDPASSRRFGMGEPVGAARNTERLNAPIEGLDSLRRFVAGTHQLPQSEWAVPTIFLAKICEAPEGEEEYNDCRYWVESGLPMLSLATKDKFDIEPDASVPAAQRTMVACNLAELVDDTHLLAVGGVVVVFEYVVEKPTPAVHRVFVAAKPLPEPTAPYQCLLSLDIGGPIMFDKPRMHA